MITAMIKLRLSLKDLYNIVIGSKWVNQQGTGIEATVGPFAVSSTVKGTHVGGLFGFNLMRDAFDKLRSNGLDRVWAMVDSRNHSSLSFGKALGFRDRSSI